MDEDYGGRIAVIKSKNAELDSSLYIPLDCSLKQHQIKMKNKRRAFEIKFIGVHALHSVMSLRDRISSEWKGG